MCLAVLAAAPAFAQTVTSGGGAEIRVLDKLTGAVIDLALQRGQTDAVGALQVMLGECRYPAGNIAGDAYAQLTLYYRDGVSPIFAGWMVASSPALSALDHPRYDVWVLRCTT